MDRNETIKTIRAALKRRSGKTWSVTGGRGTAWGWITIMSPPKRRLEFGYLSDEDRAELKQLMDLDKVHSQGIHIPSSNAYYQEHIDRAEGRELSVIGEIYWD